jgi:purine catabolism regulator
MVALRTIADIDDLAITVVRGSGALDVDLSGAHSSEQPDPTPWLSGGELLMSDGLGIADDEEQQVAYVERLARKRVAALVLGLGGPLPYAASPAGLVLGAERFGLPLLTVPVTTPFIAITQAVYTRMAAERAAISERILDAHAPLTSAAADPAPIVELAASLAQFIGGWAAVFDVARRQLAGSGHTSGTVEAAVARFLERTERNILRASLSDSGPDGAYVIQPLGIARVRGLLVYGREAGGLGEPVTRGVAEYARSLLSIELERRHGIAVLERRPGADAVRRLLSGAESARAAALLASVGVTADRVQVLSASSEGSSAATVDDLADTIAVEFPDALLLTSPTGMKAVLPAEPAIADRLKRLLGDAHAGLGGPVRPQHCPASHRQARQAQAVSGRQGGGLVEAMGLGSAHVLLQLVAPDGLTTFADAVLGPVETATNGGALLGSLRSFLASGAQVEQSSIAANVHRHTMRRHLRRIEELTGRNLDDARDRTELWLAFEARDIAVTGA